jgi:hypothetical protein
MPRINRPPRYPDPPEPAPAPDRDQHGRFREREMDPAEKTIREFGKKLDVLARQYPKHAPTLHRLAAEAEVHGTVTLTHRDMCNSLLAPLVPAVATQSLIDAGRVRVLNRAESLPHLKEWDDAMAESEAGET